MQNTDFLYNTSMAIFFEIWYNESIDEKGRCNMDVKAGEYVVYRNNGVCLVEAIVEQSMDGVNSLEYYKLKPIADANSTYYIPLTKADEKLRPLLTEEEIRNLLDALPISDDDTLWTDNRRERRERYTQIMRSNDQTATLRLISTLYFRKQKAEQKGRRFSVMDETAMKNAEAQLLQEIGFVLHLEEEDVRRFLEECVKKLQ
ncbi:MAG: hypothetical protein E7502_09470 [Ruminococcus sp.]|nr:hypothetical protein [Ruminococcus sp.]